MSEFSSEQEIEAAARALVDGQLVAFPTETVYGLGALVWNTPAINSIFALKGRPATNPLIVHLSGSEQVHEVADVPAGSNIQKWLEQLQVCWPGPLSLILPKKPNVPSEVCADLDTVAVRVPDHPVALELIEKCGHPIAAPSANSTNYLSPTKTEHVRAHFGNQIKYILDGGSCTYGIESTVVSLVHDKPTVLRPGAITKEDLESILGLEVNIGYSYDKPTKETPSPGMQQKHYAPYTPMFVVLGPQQDSLASKRTGLVCFSRKIAELYQGVDEVRVLSENGRIPEVCYKLYGTLAELDTLNLDQILIDTRINVEKDCPNSGLGAALLDRIRRAGETL